MACLYPPVMIRLLFTLLVLMTSLATEARAEACAPGPESGMVQLVRRDGAATVSSAAFAPAQPRPARRAARLALVPAAFGPVAMRGTTGALVGIDRAHE